jgi:hypothetical protein
MQIGWVLILVSMQLLWSDCGLAKSITWTDSGKNQGDWFDIANWTPEEVPGPEDDVIYLFIIDLGGEVFVSSLQQ